MHTTERSVASNGKTPIFEPWPALPLASWRDTCETLHRYLQIAGKIQLATTPRVSHFWNAALTVGPRGVATSAMTYEDRTFEIEFDFVDHAAFVRSSDGQHASVALRPLAVADFMAELMGVLAGMGIHVTIWDHPVEVFSEAIRFSEDRLHAAYDAEWVSRYWRVVLSAASALTEFRARFTGKCSGIGLYWGTFNLAAARYSGKRTPEPPQGVIESEAYSHELSEAGFWPGDARYEAPAFFAFHAPAPEGYATSRVRPAAAFWHEELSCFLLPYEAVRVSPSPRTMVLDFWQSAYEAGANLAAWNRPELERAG